MLLARVLGTLKARTPTDAWRAPSDASAAYLRFLSACGYPLAPADEIIAGGRTSEAVYADTLPTEHDQCDADELVRHGGAREPAGPGCMG